MLNFLTQLFETGEVIVPRHDSSSPQELRRLLAEFDAINRENWNGTAPEFDAVSAAASAKAMLLLCQTVVYREIDEYTVEARLAEVGASPLQSAAVHYRADLVLRFIAV